MTNGEDVSEAVATSMWWVQQRIVACEFCGGTSEGCKVGTGRCGEDEDEDDGRRAIEAVCAHLGLTASALVYGREPAGFASADNREWWQTWSELWFVQLAEIEEDFAADTSAEIVDQIEAAHARYRGVR